MLPPQDPRPVVCVLVMFMIPGTPYLVHTATRDPLGSHAERSRFLLFCFCYKGLPHEALGAFSLSLSPLSSSFPLLSRTGVSQGGSQWQGNISARRDGGVYARRCLLCCSFPLCCIGLCMLLARHLDCRKMGAFHFFCVLSRSSGAVPFFVKPATPPPPPNTPPHVPDFTCCMLIVARPLLFVFLSLFLFWPVLFAAQLWRDPESRRTASRRTS